MFKVSPSIVWWSSKKHSATALSTAQAEYLALSSAVQETIWLQNILGALGFLHLISATMHKDNE